MQMEEGNLPFKRVDRFTIKDRQQQWFHHVQTREHGLPTSYLPAYRYR
jgi:hypothetical protein